MRLVGSAAFKAVGTSDPRPAGSIPVHLRHLPLRRLFMLVAALFVLWPSGAASADPAQPGNTESIVDRIDPSTDAITADIVGGDAFLRMRVAPGHEVDVTGYDEEPYLFVDTDGTVYLNEWSPTGVLNESRYGGSQDPLPEYEPDQEPVWKKIGSGGTVMWHDHRVHWMSPLTPAAIDDEGLVQQWFVPVNVDGVPTTISGSLYVRDAPAPWWWILAVPAGLFAYVVSARWRRGGAIVVAAVLSAIGLVAYLSLPNDAREFPATSVIALFGVVTGVVALSTKRSEIRQALAAGSAVALLTAVILSRDVMSHRFVPGLDNPWMIRAIMPVALGVSVLALWKELNALLRAK